MSTAKPSTAKRYKVIAYPTRERVSQQMPDQAEHAAFDTVGEAEALAGAAHLADYCQVSVVDSLTGSLHWQRIDGVVSQSRQLPPIQQGNSAGHDEYSVIVDKCAKQGRALMQMLASSGMPESLYLYARESVPGRPGELFLVRAGAPNTYGYRKVAEEGLRTDVPYDKYFQWVYERARSAPILSIAEERKVQQCMPEAEVFQTRWGPLKADEWSNGAYAANPVIREAIRKLHLEQECFTPEAREYHQIAEAIQVFSAITAKAEPEVTGVMPVNTMNVSAPADAAEFASETSYTAKMRVARIEQAMRAWHIANETEGDIRSGYVSEYSVVLMLADLRHYCDAYGLDLGQLDRHAQADYLEQLDKDRQNHQVATQCEEQAPHSPGM